MMKGNMSSNKTRRGKRLYKIQQWLGGLPKRNIIQPFQKTSFSGSDFFVVERIKDPNAEKIHPKIDSCIPGSSKCVKFLFFGGFFDEKAQILHTWKIQVYVLLSGPFKL